MNEPEDSELLRRFAEDGAETAFAALVGRHLNLVYSAALRHTRNPHAAEEVTQAVFIILARKAQSLSPRTIVSGWLYQTARLTAANYLRTEFRRARREQEMLMQSLVNEPTPEADEAWPHIAPLLDTALGELSDKDRCAIVLRYFENKSLRDVGLALGTSEDAAKMRVNRALEKLRRFFTKRRVTLSTPAIAAAVSANAVQAAPGQSAARVVSAAAKDASVAASVLALVKGTLPLLTWTRYKLAFGWSAAGILAAGAITTAILSHSPADRLPVTAVAVPSRSVAVLEEPGPPEPREPFTGTTLFTFEAPPGALAVQPDGKILVAATLGGFAVDETSGRLGWYTRGVMRFEANGALDRSFYCDVGRPEATSAMAAQLSLLSDGRVFVSGVFDTVDGKPRHGHAILLADGRLDETFDP